MADPVDSAPRAAQRSGARALPGKYLTFELGQEIYGIEILKVQEIIGIMKVTRVPGTPACVRGVINLRGKVIPVIDLRSKFELGSLPDTERTCIVVVQLRRAAGAVTMGVIVDQVREVLDIVAGQIEPTPEFGEGIDTATLLGIAKVATRVVMLLDVERALGGEAASVDKPAA